MKIEMYILSTCPYCSRAKQLLESKGVKEITFYDVGKQPELWNDSKKRSGGRETVPQIFINEQHVGGCDDLFALDKAGGLDPLLG